MNEFSLSVYESYTNSWIVELKNSDDKLLLWENNTDVKDGIITVVNKFIEKFPEHRKAALEAMYESVENSKDCSYCKEGVLSC